MDTEYFVLFLVFVCILSGAALAWMFQEPVLLTLGAIFLVLGSIIYYGLRE